jgi:hypothetical protein
MLPKQAVLNMIDETLKNDPWAWDLRENRAAIARKK